MSSPFFRSEDFGQDFKQPDDELLSYGPPNVDSSGASASNRTGEPINGSELEGLSHIQNFLDQIKKTFDGIPEFDKIREAKGFLSQIDDFITTKQRLHAAKMKRVLRTAPTLTSRELEI